MVCCSMVSGLGGRRRGNTGHNRVSCQRKRWAETTGESEGGFTRELVRDTTRVYQHHIKGWPIGRA